jgi:hypothetical protein
MSSNSCFSSAMETNHELSEEIQQAIRLAPGPKIGGETQRGGKLKGQRS